jgi:hypothetical protein
MPCASCEVSENQNLGDFSVKTYVWRIIFKAGPDIKKNINGTKNLLQVYSAPRAHGRIMATAGVLGEERVMACAQVGFLIFFFSNYSFIF